MKKIAKEQGVVLGRRRAGEIQSEGEEEEYERLNREARKLETKERAKIRKERVKKQKEGETDNK